MRTWIRWLGAVGIVAALAWGAGAKRTDVGLLHKENPDGVGIWLGTVSGAVDGGLQTILLNADQSEPVWRTRDRRGGVIRPVGSTQ